MTPPRTRPRRGRPTVFNDAMQTRYLDAITAGMRLGEAAQHVGIHSNVPTRLARKDQEFATRLADARTAGRKTRADNRPHGEAHYNNDDCRHPDCAAAARKGRARRRATTGRQPDREQHATIHDLDPPTPPKSPISLPLLLKAS